MGNTCHCEQANESISLNKDSAAFSQVRPEQQRVRIQNTEFSRESKLHEARSSISTATPSIPYDPKHHLPSTKDSLKVQKMNETSNLVTELLKMLPPIQNNQSIEDQSHLNFGPYKCKNSGSTYLG